MDRPALYLAYMSSCKPNARKMKKDTVNIIEDI